MSKFDIDDPNTWDQMETPDDFRAPHHYIGIEKTEYGKFCYTSFSFKYGTVDGECFDTVDELFHIVRDRFDLTKEDMRKQSSGW